MNHIHQGHQALTPDLYFAFLGKETLFSTFSVNMSQGKGKPCKNQVRAFPVMKHFYKKQMFSFELLPSELFRCRSWSPVVCKCKYLEAGKGGEGSFPFLPVCKSCFLLASATLMNLNSVKGPLFQDINMILESIMYFLIFNTRKAQDQTVSFTVNVMCKLAIRCAPTQNSKPPNVHICVSTAWVFPLRKLRIHVGLPRFIDSCFWHRSSSPHPLLPISFFLLSAHIIWSSKYIELTTFCVEKQEYFLLQ